jgi:FKBP-type peptidyl-prolyl cis-trans isomerase SlyD
MNVQKDCVVSIEFELRNREGEVLDASEGDELLEYLHGHGEIVPGLEQALEGLKSGDQRKVVVPAQEGYGDRDEEAVFPVARTLFPADLELEVGGSYMGSDEGGNAVPVTVVRLEGDEVWVDANHPLAGEELHFDVKVRNIRAATAEELKHGHAHGAHGHDHDHDHDHGAHTHDHDD